MEMMKQSIKINFKKQNWITEFQNSMIFLSGAALFFCYFLFQNYYLNITILGVLILQVILSKIPDGKVEIYKEGGQLFFLEKDNDIPQKIIKHKFRWSYKHVQTAEIPTASSPMFKRSHANYIVERLDIALEDGNYKIIFKILNPWQSIPNGWEYEVFKVPENATLILSQNPMKKVKSFLEG